MEVLYLKSSLRIGYLNSSGKSFCIFLTTTPTKLQKGFFLVEICGGPTFTNHIVDISRPWLVSPLSKGCSPSKWMVRVTNHLQYQLGWSSKWSPRNSWLMVSLFSVARWDRPPPTIMDVENANRHPKTMTRRNSKLVVCKCFSFSKAIFSGSMFSRVWPSKILLCCHIPLNHDVRFPSSGGLDTTRALCETLRLEKGMFDNYSSDTLPSKHQLD